jgi:hypothetical protein
MTCFSACGNAFLAHGHGQVNMSSHRAKRRAHSEIQADSWQLSAGSNSRLAVKYFAASCQLQSASWIFSVLHALCPMPYLRFALGGMTDYLR